MVLPVLLTGLFAPGCGAGDGTERASFRILGPAELLSDGTCSASAEANSSRFASGSEYRLRLTFRLADAGPLLCDLVIPVDQVAPTIAVPQTGADDRVDIIAEFFAGAADATLQASGTRTAVALRSGGPLDIWVTPRDEFSCARQPAGVARAFHSMTVLPSGQVLLVGGVTTSPDAPGLLALDSLELYDPDERTFRPVSAPGLLPRAFHEAVVVGAAGDLVTIALVGGLTVSGDAATSLAARVERGRRSVRGPRGRLRLPARVRAAIPSA